MYESRASITVGHPTSETSTSSSTSSSASSQSSSSSNKNKRNVSFSNSVQVQDIPSNEDNRMNKIRSEIGSPSVMAATSTLGTIREEPIHEVEDSPRIFDEKFQFSQKTQPRPEPIIESPRLSDSTSRFNDLKIHNNLPYLSDGIDLSKNSKTIHIPTEFVLKDKPVIKLEPGRKTENIELDITDKFDTKQKPSYSKF